MKRIFLFFLLIIILLGLVRAVTEIEQSVEATVTVNPFPGELSASPESLAVNSVALSFVEKTLTFQQEGNIDLNVSLFLEVNAVNDWLSFSAINFTVKPQEERKITAFINIPAVEPGIYSTNIHALGDNQDLVIPINITITNRYRISVKIDALEKKVIAGNSVSVFTELTKTKQRKKDPEVEGRITVDLVYNVLKGKKLITTLSTTMNVTDSNADTILITIPTEAAKGRYTVEVTATHLDKTAKSRDNFQVTASLFTSFFNFFRELI